MGLLSKLAERFGYQKANGKKSPGYQLNVRSGSSPFVVSDRTSKADMIKQNIGWVFACSSAIGEEIAGSRLRLFSFDSDGNQQEEYQHELLTLLARPNPSMTSWQLRFLLGVHLVITGEAYWFLEKGANGKITGIYPLPVEKVNPIFSESAGKEGVVTGYAYKMDGKEPVKYELDQIISFSFPDASRLFGGIGVVDAVRAWVDAANFQDEFNLNFFKNGAFVSGFLTSEHIQSTEMLDYMRDQFVALFGGVKNSHKVVALPEGTDYKPSQATRKDMDFNEGTKSARDMILAAFRVPKTVLGITDDVNRANAEATDYVFARRTIKPKLDLIESVLNTTLVQYFGDSLVLAFDDPTPIDKQQQNEKIKTMTGGQPIMTPNEAREEFLGYEKVNGGDSLYMDSSKVPVGTVITKPKPAKIRGKQLQQPQKSAKSSIAEDVAKKAVEVISASVQPASKSMQPTTKAFIERIDPYEKKLKKKLIKYNAEVLADVLKRLPKLMDSSKAVDKEQILDQPEQVRAVIRLFEEDIFDLYGKEGTAAAAVVGVSEFTITSELKKAIVEALTLLAESYTNTTVEAIGKAIEDGLAEGLNLGAVEEGIRKVFEYADNTRADMLARTEVYRVTNSAARDAWKQTGVVKTIKWKTAEDEKTCPFCAPLDGKIIGINDVFFKNGDTVEGEDGKTFVLDYEDVGNPPLHPNCRCEVFPEDIQV